MGKKKRLGDILEDAHAHFYILRGDEAIRLKLYEITDDALVIETPKNSPLRKTILGYVPTLLGNAIFEIEGEVVEPMPDQMDDTIRVRVLPENARKVNRRLFPRHSFTPPVPAKISSKKEKGVVGRIVNLSAGGLRIETDKKLPPADKYTFEFEVPVDDETHLFKLDGHIVYEIPLTEGFSYGVRFGMSEEDAKGPLDEAPAGELDKTVDLLGLVNKLIVKSDSQ